MTKPIKPKKRKREMLVTLRQHEVEAAVIAYVVTQGINITGKKLEVQFSSARSAGGLLAEVDLIEPGTEPVSNPVKRVIVAEAPREQLPVKESRATVISAPQPIPAPVVVQEAKAEDCKVEPEPVKEVTAEEPKVEKVNPFAPVPVNPFAPVAAPVQEPDDSLDSSDDVPATPQEDPAPAPAARVTSLFS